MASPTYLTHKYKTLLLGAIENQSTEDALALCQMIHDKQLRISVIGNKNETLFIVASKFGGTCIKCFDPVIKGDAVFVRNSKPWHLGCASSEDLKNTYLITCIQKELVDFELPELEVLIAKRRHQDIINKVIPQSRATNHQGE